MISELQKEFKNEIEKVNLVKKFGTTYIEVITNLSDLNSITKLTKEISIFLKQNNNKEYLLEVLSIGTEGRIKLNSLNEHINKNIKVALKSSLIYEGILNKINDDSIVVKYNHKGQFRNKIIFLKEIEKVNKSAIIQKKKKRKTQ